MNQTSVLLRSIIGKLEGGSKSGDKINSAVDELRLLAEQMEWGEKNEVDFKAIVDSSSDGIYVVDKDLVLRYINPAYAEYTHLDPKEVLGKTSQELVDEGIFQRVATPDVVQSKKTHVLLGYVRTVDNKDIYGYCIVRPVLDKNGEVRYAVVTLYDPDKLKGRYSEFAGKSDSVAPPIVVREKIEGEMTEPVIGSGQPIRQVYDIAGRVSATDATVMIYGESGVGKEGVADYICMHSPRASKPFVKVNCTAIPANLLESELFGYEKGAFTGANKTGKKGLFELANGGTILLDEIGDLPIDLQAKLLRAIQQREILRIGGTTPIQLDVRIIASTNADLKGKMLEGKFREDLYYRLSTIPITVPPLRERKEDIPELIEYYLDYFGRHHHRTVGFSDEIMSILQRYDWPGNIRQLKNIIEYLVVCGDSEYLSNAEPLLKILGINDLPEESNILPSLEERMNSYEKTIIVQALNKSGGVRKAAMLLGVNAATISRKAKKYNIPLPREEKNKPEF